MRVTTQSSLSDLTEWRTMLTLAGTAHPLYNMGHFSPKYSQKAPHSSPVRVSYGVSFVSLKCDQYPTLMVILH